ncbi:MAG: hypothetical protein JNL11_00555 [Bdellovibrionaceae bacterium]|nr:hypothetical protein [Pseudobdellovibrionaceae bacterium]
MASCSSKSIAPSPTMKLISESDYQQTIKKNARQEQVYSGLYNAIDMTGMIINSEVSEAQVDQMARVYIWDENKYTQEKVKSEDKLRKESEFFVSFFTPERKHDDLHKNKTLWKIFLDVDGKRFEGKVSKVKLLTEEIQSLYPFHNRFSTPYSIVFPVAMKQIEQSASIKLTITGPVGSSTVDFARK